MPFESVRDRYVQDGAGVVPQPRLLVMLYDRLVNDLQQANVALGEGRLMITSDKLLHAQQIIMELHSALDTNAWDGAEALSQLYSWFHKELMEANSQKSSKKIRSCLHMVTELQGAWQQAYDQLLGEQEAARTAAGVSATSIPSA